MCLAVSLIIQISLSFIMFHQISTLFDNRNTLTWLIKHLLASRLPLFNITSLKHLLGAHIYVLQVLFNNCPFSQTQSYQEETAMTRLRNLTSLSVETVRNPYCVSMINQRVDWRTMSYPSLMIMLMTQQLSLLLRIIGSSVGDGWPAVKMTARSLESL